MTQTSHFGRGNLPLLEGGMRCSASLEVVSEPKHVLSQVGRRWLGIAEGGCIQGAEGVRPKILTASNNLPSPNQSIPVPTPDTNKEPAFFRTERNPDKFKKKVPPQKPPGQRKILRRGSLLFQGFTSIFFKFIIIRVFWTPHWSTRRGPIDAGDSRLIRAR